MSAFPMQAGASLHHARQVFRKLAFVFLTPHRGHSRNTSSFQNSISEAHPEQCWMPISPGLKKAGSIPGHRLPVIPGPGSRLQSVLFALPPERGAVDAENRGRLLEIPCLPEHFLDVMFLQFLERCGLLLG
jgi:hypothetical protein